MKTNRLASVVMKLGIGALCMGLFLSGCGSGGGGSNKGGGTPDSATLTGTVFKPSGDISTPKLNSVQLQKSLVAFDGANVEVIGLDDGSRYPKDGGTIVNSTGKFEISGVPLGQNYLIKAKKGNLVMMKLKYISADGRPRSINIGTVDPASTAAALLAEQYIKDALGGVEINLISGPPNGVDPQEFEAALLSAEPDKLEEEVRNHAGMADGVSSTEPLPEELEEELKTDNEDVNLKILAMINVYLFVVDLINAGDETILDENVLDLISDWKIDGVIGDSTQITSVTITESLTIVENTVTPEDLNENLITVSRPYPILGSRPPALSNSNSSNIDFVANKTGAQFQFQCKLDDGNWGACTSPVHYPDLADGVHTFCVKVTVEVANHVIESPPFCHTWTVDTTPPDTTITGGQPPNPFNSSEVSFSFVSTEANSTFECQMDEGGWSSCASPKDYSGLADGSHTFEVRATDAAGNTDPTPASHAWTVDTAPPDTSITDKPSDPSSLSTANFTFGSTEAGSTFQCQLDSGIWGSCASPKDYTGLSDGSHTFGVRATDPAGNTDPTPVSYMWTVNTTVPDTTPPDTLITGQPPNPSNSNAASFSFSCSESGCTFECQMDGGGWSSCTSPKDYTGLSDSGHTFDVRATDAAGNTDQSPASYTWTVSQNPDSLVAYYPFNGNANDESGNGHNGTVNGAILTADQLGVPNSTYSFDGNDRITVPDSSMLTLGSDSFTITAWVQLNTLGLDGGYYLMGHSEGPGSTNKWIFWLANNGISFIVGPSPGWISLGSANFEIGRWYHVVVRRNTNELTAFVNGLPIGTADIGTLNIPDPNASLQIGTAEFDQPNRPFQGQIDEVRIYKRALSDIEVLSMFKEGIAYRSDTTSPETAITGNPANLSNSTSASFEFTSNELDSNFQWKSSDGGNGHFYRAIHAPQGISWIDANTAAQAMGGGWHLATIASAAENAFVYSLVNGDSSFWNCCLSNNSAGPWLGGLNVGPGVGDYAWVTGEPFTYTNWGPLEPFGNGDRIGLFGYQAAMGPYWNDVPATRLEFGYIVETSDIMGSPVVSFQCELDGGGYSDCSSPKNYLDISDGEHTFCVAATDFSGNTDPTPACYVWTVDTTNPIFVSSIPANGATNVPVTERTISFTFNEAMGPGYSVTWTGDSGGNTSTSWSSDKNTISFTFDTDLPANTTISWVLNPSNYPLNFRDIAGNPLPADTYSGSFTTATAVDITPPDTLITGQPANPSNSNAASFSFSCSEAGCTFECQMDGGGWSSCTSPKDYTGLADGDYTFEVQATDAAGNTDPSPASYTWTVDTVAPETTITSQPSNPSTSGTATFSFISSEASSTFECQMDSGGFSSCVSPKTYVGLSSSDHTFDVKATNAAGNADPTPASYTWTVDTTDAPETTIISKPQDPSNSTSAAFSFTSSQISSTFQCEIDGGGLADCASPTGYYTVLANGVHTFCVTAVNRNGTADPTPACYSWTVSPIPPPSPIFFENFDGGLGNWAASNGIWEVGVPTSGPNAAYSSPNVAATVLGGDYPNTNSRLESLSIQLPTIEAGEELHLRFWHWFSFGSYDAGYVQIQEETSPGVWSSWTSLTGYAGYNGGVWTYPRVDLSAYAGKKVRIGFLLSNGSSSYVGPGWYIDDISITVVQTITLNPGDSYSEGFENGLGDWWASNGTWEVGLPTSGPGGAYTGTNAAGTVLGGDYPNTNSYLVSPTMALPTIEAGEELHLRFWHWFSFGSYDAGYVQIQEETAPGVWSSWTDLLGAGYAGYNGGVWTYPRVDLSAYAGKKVRIGFLLLNGSSSYVGPGWYIDDISITVVQTITLNPGDSYSEGFENGLGDWWASNGTWEVGLPTSGPGGAYTGTNAAGTVLGGDYPNTNSYLVSPTMVLPAIQAGEELHLRFWHWFSFGSYDAGYVRIQEETAPGVWSSWTDLPGAGYAGYNGGVWTYPRVDLSAYAGKKVRIGFLLLNGSSSYVGPGWYIDDISITVVQTITLNPGDSYSEGFENGLGDWWASNGTWEVGLPTSGPGGAYTGTNAAGTVLGGDYPNTNSYLVSPTMVLPAIQAGEELHLRFWHWFSFGSYDAGYVRIQEETAPGVWSSWTDLPGAGYAGYNGGVWTYPRVDLSAYAGKKVRIGFLLLNGSSSYVGPGWYIDDISIFVLTL